MKQKAELEKRMMGDGSDNDDDDDEGEKEEKGKGESKKSLSVKSSEDSGCSWGMGELLFG